MLFFLPKVKINFALPSHPNSIVNFWKSWPGWGISICHPSWKSTQSTLSLLCPFNLYIPVNIGLFQFFCFIFTLVLYWSVFPDNQKKTGESHWMETITPHAQLLFVLLKLWIKEGFNWVKIFQRIARQTTDRKKCIGALVGVSTTFFCVLKDCDH